MLAEQILAGANFSSVETHNRLLLQIDEFVAQIDRMVVQMEVETEQRIRLMRGVLLVALGLTVLVLLVGLYLIHRRVLIPLDALRSGAARIAAGDFTARTLHAGRDELGQVGQAFNTMAEAVSRSHHDLEARVREKTAELTRSNRSLALLYNAITLLHNAPTAPETYRAVLAEIDTLLQLRGSRVCLGVKHDGPSVRLATSLPPCTRHGSEGCGECLRGLEGEDRLGRHEPGAEADCLDLPLRDKDGLYGVMRLALPSGLRLEPWQEQLLEALIRHMGIALGMSEKAEQDRLLALQEERSIIARELHDSIAQSLSYMKIQASLLQPVLSDPGRHAQAEIVLRDLREGISTAYRQLRELLATFRLRMEGDFMALMDTAVEEYASRGGIPVHLEIRLAGCRLTPNQEIHVLRIVREALSNVLRHAQAAQVWVRVAHRGGGEVEVCVADDGIGLGRPGQDQAGETFHYGVAIMRERAGGLKGALEVRDRPEGGTMVALRFQAEAISLNPQPSYA